jgi:sulfite exporter TauE/SafE/copper chaperone CopZ
MKTIEEQGLQKRSFRIGGMFCIQCRNTIEKELKKTAGVRDAKVNYRTGAASVSYDGEAVGFDKISGVIESLGYRTLEERGKAGFQSRTIPQIAGTLAVIFALFMLMRVFTTGKLAAAFPLAQEGMGYGMLLVIGLLTGVHCIAMCGGINLSQTLRGKYTGKYSLLLPSILYNGGRLVSYTAVGVIVGSLGSVITLSGHFKGMMQLIAGIFMVIMGINMTGLFPALRRLSLYMPNVFAKKIDERKTGRGPLVVGFLNGFMPCGPLQAMQVFALSTGSPIRGGISMFLFCAGTIPLMFALGTASSVLSGATSSGAKGQTFSRRVMQIGAVLVAALGLAMFSNGWSLSGFAGKPVSVPEKNAPLARRQIQTAPDSSPQDISPKDISPKDISPKDISPKDISPKDSSPPIPVIENGVQIVNSVLRSNRYPAITVQQGIPVRWSINAPPGSINGCNYAAILYEYDIEHVFKQGDNVIEFTPVKAGRFGYSCWMGMIRSTITVLPEAGKEVN